ncbi:hypothetical protein EDWATA_03482 [Edwardsiella tarda ATCC 23685]|uniref:Uncharacterized protein n=1 Tax=Edwardsiella tarda ATCC 23685 TaxID=500638 RepID=D4F9M3_EDWTA|nr:hypothetical protein EDWATA_03482 [Edwardsiella tarda ATCC 23685]
MRYYCSLTASLPRGDAVRGERECSLTQSALQWYRPGGKTGL